MLKWTASILVLLCLSVAARAVVIPLYDPYAVHTDGADALIANWDAGGYEIRSLTFESDVATGTAPFTIASTTLVSNLNVDKADGYDFDQDVTTSGTPSFTTINGIGISAPSTTSITFAPSDGLSSSELKYSSLIGVGWTLTNPVVSGKVLSVTNTCVLDQDLQQSASPTFAGLTLDLTQDYAFADRGSGLTITGQTAGSPIDIEVYSADADGTDDVLYHLYGHGATDYHRLTAGWDVSESSYVIASMKGGAQSLQPIKIYAYDTGQLVLAADGDNSMSGALGVTGAITGGSFVTGGNIGVSGDVDLLSLAANALTVNGTGRFSELGLGIAPVSNIIGLYMSNSFNHAAGQAYGINSTTTYTGNQDASTVAGVNFAAKFGPTSPTAARTVSILVGSQGVATLQNTTAQNLTATTAKAYSAQLISSETGAGISTIVDGYNIHIVAPSLLGGGLITNLYGMKIEDMSVGGTLNYAIYTGAGLVRFGDKVIFTQTDGNEYIDSLNDGYMDYGATTAHRFNNDLVLPKTSGKGIKVDNTTPTFGWRDLLGEIRTRGVGATDPGDATYIGNIKAYQFAVNDECWVNYHVPHDYVPGTDIHFHFHWSHNSAIVTGGSVTWGADITYAKGHNQAAFAATVNPTVVGNASTTQYQHIITEVQISAGTPGATQIDSDDLEPDGVIMVRAYLSANNITSSGAVPDPFLHFVDIHYQSTNIGTKAKAPDFHS